MDTIFFHVYEKVFHTSRLIPEKLTYIAVADLGGGTFSPSQAFDPLPTQRATLVLFWDIQFWLNDLKIFVKAPLEPVYTNFEGGARAKKNAIFVSKFSKECLKTPKSFFNSCFSQIMPIDLLTICLEHTFRSYLVLEKSKFLFRPVQKWVIFVFGYDLVFSFLFTQSQTPQIIIKLGRMINQIETIPVKIRTNTKTCYRKFPSIEKNWLKNFYFSINFEWIMRASRLTTAFVSLI